MSRRLDQFNVLNSNALQLTGNECGGLVDVTSGRVLMLGMRSKSFNSSRKRFSFVFAKEIAGDAMTGKSFLKTETKLLPEADW
jgi:hypothetical protein